MRDWLAQERGEAIFVFFWRWHENPAQNFCYILLPEPGDSETESMVTGTPYLLGTTVAAKPLPSCPKLCVEGTQGCT